MYTLTKRETVFTLAGVLVSLLLGALDQTIVSTAMPKILQDLNGLSLYTWVVTAYLLASTAMIPIYGKLSDLYGRKLIVLAGVIIFLAGSVLSGQARSMIELIAFRAFQGLGSAGIFSTAFTVVADIFPPADRGKYQGLFGAAFGISSVIGPWLGGLLTDSLSWRWVFYVNMPIGLIALLFIILWMPPLKPKLTEKVVIDWWGSVTLLLGIVPILLALTLGGSEYPWGSWQVLGLFGIGAVGIAAFVLAEMRAHEPILPFDLFKSKTFVLGNAAALLVGGVAFFGAILFLPIYMVMVVGVSASAAGLTIMPLTMGLVVSSFISGQIVSRLGRYKIVLLAGIALVFVGYLAMGGLSVHTTRAEMTWRMILLGIGMGPALPIFTLAVQNAVAPTRLGAATGSSQFFRQIGATVGVAVFGTILSTTLAAQLPKYMPAELQSAQMGAMNVSMGELQSGNLDAVGGEIKAGFEDVYKKIELALTRNDQAAIQSLAEDPRIPAEYRGMFGRGSIEQQVRVSLEAQYASIAATLQSGKPGALGALANDPRLPAELKGQLARIPPASLANPAALNRVLAQIKQGMDAQASVIIEKATQDALSQVRASLDAAAEKTVTGVTVALKTAFTDAIKRVYFWGLFVVAGGFLITLFMPGLPLRRRETVTPPA